jgi:Ni/Co efflux regulator RcnB
MNELIVPVLLAALLSGGQGAHARGQHGPQAGKPALEAQAPAAKGGPGAGYRSVRSNGDLTRGEQLPPRYRAHQYVIENWRGHRLSEPPRGHQWVQAGSRFALVAIATGVVTEVVVAK